MYIMLNKVENSSHSDDFKYQRANLLTFLIHPEIFQKPLLLLPLLALDLQYTVFNTQSI